MTHPYDDIEAFALGALDEAEASCLHEHAEQCPTCAILLADAMRTMHSALGDVQNAPPVRVAFVKPRSAWRWTTRFIDLAAVAACVALLVWTFTLRTQAGVTADLPVAALVHSHFTHHVLHGGSGSAKVLLAADGRWILVVADGLQPRSSYQVTATLAGRRVAIGSLSTDRQGVTTGFWRLQPSAIAGVTVASASGPSADSDLRWP
ncbi:MAG: hypothetical protein M3Z37_09855 [Candidatus Eremiobacteraeota bacterium]|nr:hypothetical protein [Candidatus Eremiobacteraeota bacterium]